MRGTGHQRLKRLRDRHGIDGKDRKVGLIAVPTAKASVDPNTANRDILIIANTDDVDLDMEVVVPAGADMTYYEKNRANFIDHWYDFQSHVGSMRSIRPTPSAKNQRGWINRSHIFDGLKNPLAEDLLTVARQVGIAASIGFELMLGSPPLPDDPPHYKGAGYVVRRWRMIELSFTAMPCNVSCQSLDEGAVDDSKVGALDELVSKGIIKRASARALGMPDRKVIPMATIETKPRRKLLLMPEEVTAA